MHRELACPTPNPPILYKSRHRRTFNRLGKTLKPGEKAHSPGWVRALSSQKWGSGALRPTQPHLQVDAVTLKAAECLARAGAGVAARMGAAGNRASRRRARWGWPWRHRRGGRDARWEGKGGTLCPTAVAHHRGRGCSPPSPPLAPGGPSASPAAGRCSLGEALDSLVLVLLRPPRCLQPPLPSPLLALQQHLLGEGGGWADPSHRQ